MKLSFRIGISASVSTAVVLLISRSVSIALAFGILASAIAFLAIRTKNNTNEAAMTAAWPEVIDHLMSGIQSGLSLTESLAGLSTRGPDVLRPAFHRTPDRHNLLLHPSIHSEKHVRPEKSFPR